MKPFFPALLLGLVFSQGLPAQDTLYPAVEALYAATAPDNALLANFDVYLAQAERLPWSQDRELSRAQALMFKGVFWMQRGRNDLAEPPLNQAEALAQAVQSPPYYRAYQVLSDIRTKFMLLKGVPYIIANSGAIEDLAKKALALQPGDAISTIIIAFGKINAPGLFGGDPDLGLRQLTALLTRPDLPSVYRFTAWLGIAEAWKKKSGSSQREAALAEAARLFPQNPDLKRARSN